MKNASMIQGFGIILLVFGFMIIPVGLKYSAFSWTVGASILLGGLYL